MTAIYIHWPFCDSKCPYCDFNSKVNSCVDQNIWGSAFAHEIAHYAQRLPDIRISSIFFGGGTPSLMDVKTVETILYEIAKHWAIENDAEITLEANPSSSESSKFADLSSIGITRLSLGVQSFDDNTLRFLGRIHNAEEAKQSVALSAKHFTRSSFDLIYGFTGHTPHKWRQDLDEAVSMADGHLSLYQLTLEPKTPFYIRACRGERLISTQSDDLYEITQDILGHAGLPAYEVSNHARTEHQSRHNLTYWRYEDYIGIGPGAHGRIGIGKAGATVYATENIRAPDAWLANIASNGTGIDTEEPLDLATTMREALIMGLRLTDGIDTARWCEKFGVSINDFLDAGKLDRLIAEDLIVKNTRSIRATPQGLQKLDAILSFL